MTLLFSDNFDAVGWNGTDQGWSSILGAVSPTTARPHSGAKSLECNFEAGYEQSRGLYKEGGMGWTDIYARWYTYYNAGFTWDATSANKKEFRTGTVSNPSDDLVFDTNGNGDGSAVSWALYSNQNYLHGGQAWFYANLVNVHPTPGQWFCVEVHLKTYTGDTANGIFECWIDGTKTHDYPNIYTSPNAFGLMTLVGVYNASPGHNMTQYIDSFVVSDVYNGLGGGDIPPTGTIVLSVR